MNDITLRKPHNIALGSLIYLVSCLAVACMAAAVKLVPYNVNIGTIIFFQYAVALILCLPSLLQQGITNLKTQNFIGHLLRDVSGVLTFGFFFWSLTYISLVNAIVLRSTTPFWIPLILLAWRGDRVSKGLWLSIIVGFIGVILITKPGVDNYFNIGALLALTSGLVMGISALAIRKLSATEPASRTLFYYFLIATVVSLPFAIFHWVALQPYTWLLLIIIGVLMYGIQYTLILAFRYAKASALSPISYSAIIFSGILDWLLWHKTPDLYGYIGIILIIGAGITTLLFERKKEKT